MPLLLKKVLVTLICIASFIFVLFNSNVRVYAEVTPPPANETKPTTGTKPDIGVVGGARQNSTTKSGSFTECDFSSVNSKADGSAKFIGCIRGIVTFIFVVSLFLVAIRIAVEALGSLNPFEKGKAIDNSAKLVNDIIIGLLILGAPSIFLNFLNPQTLQIDIIKNISEGSKTIKTPGGAGPVAPDGSLTLATAGGDISKKDILDAAKNDPAKSKAISDQIKSLADKVGTVDGYNSLIKYLDAVKASGGRPVLDAILQTNNYQMSAMYTPNQAITTLTGDATFANPSGDYKELQLTFTTNPLKGIVVMPQSITLISDGAGCSANPPSATIKAGTALGNSGCQYKVKGS
jgi:hypothetical protein